ncbi:hypothetical protein CRYUN_Cryun37aG0117100 [Craigia yunnanensis]
MQRKKTKKKAFEKNKLKIRAKLLKLARPMKRKRVTGGESEALDEAVRKLKLKRGDLPLELIRMVLKREIEKKKSKESDCSDEEEEEKGYLMRELPNGLMAISSSSLHFDNAGSCSGSGSGSVSDYEAQGVKQLQEAARRENSNDNFLFYPSIMNIHGDNLEHFQEHWGKGHPVIVRNVLQDTSDLSWGPVFLFCSYLKNSVAKAENEELTKATGCLDWFEVEIGIKQLFLGSLRGLTQSNMCDKKLKLKGWLSFHLFQEQFPDHYTEIIRALPLPEYMDPRSGLLNIAARLPQEITKPNLGPCVSISYCSGEELVQAKSVTKLCYGLGDVDVPKLMEYLRKHSNEFGHTCGFRKNVVHPILDQHFFLDTSHKIRLKEEYEIEPWTFEQHVGEAVIIPAGCPYQIRNVKVEKMALYRISAAIKEIRELTCAESSAELSE